MRLAPSFRLLLVTDRRLTDDLPALLRGALGAARPGEVAVMLREKDLPARRLLELAMALRRVTREAGALFLVNDRVDVALAAGADGVHLPSAGLPPDAVRRLLGDEGIIGVSTHSEDEAARAEAAGADYVTFGPVFPTPSKAPYGDPVGLERLAALEAHLPVYGLGGIDAETAGAVRSAGARGVACIRAVLAAPEPADAVRRFLKALGLR